MTADYDMSAGEAMIVLLCLAGIVLIGWAYNAMLNNEDLKNKK